MLFVNVLLNLHRINVTMISMCKINLFSLFGMKPIT